MMKRILSFALVLAMLVSALPVSISAEATEPGHTHSDAHKCSEQCAGGTVTWTPWGKTNGNNTSLPTASGHYYLESNITVAAWVELAAGLDITICLNGYNISETASASGNQRVHGKLTISDCTAHYDSAGNYISGAVTGCKQGDGAFMNVRRGGTLVLESGKLSGNTATGGGGAVSLQATSGSNQGGIFHMYGGEITGNRALNGGGIVSNNGGSVYIHGGKIYGNTASGNGQAIYISGASSKLVVSGSPYIGQVYFDNASNPGLQVNGLTEHTKITVNTKTAGAAIDKVIKIADGGKQDTWDCHWVSINNKSVSKDSSGFKFGHFHDGVEYSARINTMPEGKYLDQMNYYYLTQDLTLPADRASHVLRTPVTMCLNGYTVTQSNASSNIYEITGSLTLEDGWAYTDENGIYHSGGFTGTGTQTAATGTAFYVNGGSLTLKEGQIFGFTGSHNDYGTPIYVANKGAVTVSGGSIHDNTATKGRGGAILSRGANVTVTGGVIENNQAAGSQGGGIALREASVFTMSGGTIRGNSSKADGGGIYCHNSAATITGGTITGNRSAASAGGIGFGSAATATISGLTISGNTAPNGAGMIVQGSSKVTMASSTVTGNEGKLGGGIYLTGTTSLTLTGTAITGNTASSKGGGIYWDNKDSKLALSGSTQIQNNGTHNLFMNNAAQMLAVTDLGDSAKVGLSNRSGFASQELTGDYSAKFFCDDGENVVSFKENKLYISNGHDHCQDGATDCGHTQEGWTKWTATDSLPTGAGNYFLDQDVKLTGRWDTSSDIKLCLNGHTITQTKAGQRIIKISAGTLTLTDCQGTGKLTGGTATADGGGIRVEGKAAALNAYNVTITGNTTTGHGGGIFAVTGAQVSLTNVTIEGNKANGSTGGGIALREGAKLTMVGGTVENNYSKADGAGVYAHKDSVTTLTDTVIKNNTSAASAGGIGFGSTATATLTNVTIEGNCAPNGAGMIVQGSSKVTMTGCTVTGNKGQIGGIYVISQLTMNGGTVTENEASVRGGGIYVPKGGKLTLEGAAVIRSNQGGNLYLVDGTTVQVGTMVDGASVSVTANPGAISGACDDHSGYFVSDSGYRNVAYVDGALHMVAGGEHKHCLCDGTVEACDHSHLNWAAWEATNSLPTSGCYYLLGDVVLTSEMSITGDLQLCLNGYTVKAAKNERILSTVKNRGVSISISDCTGKGQLTGGVDVANETGGGAIFIRAGSTLNLYGGKITGNKSITAGGGILLAADSKFFMYGGEISGNGAKDEGEFIDGGAVYMISGAEATIAGGTIANNAGEDGAGIFISTNSKLTVTGGTITGNHASAQGGGMYAYGGTAIITGGQITNNTALACAGGAGFGKGAQATIAGGVISGNTSPNGGGVLAQGGATLNLEGGEITGNTSTGSAGGVYINSGSFFNMTGGTVSNNKASGNGGGVFALKATSKLTGGTVSGNTSVKDGAGVYGSGGTMELGGKLLVTGNQTKGAGGGAGFTRQCEGRITGGTFQNNKATNAGGLIIQGKANAQITGGTFQGNTAESSGGAVYVNVSTLRMSGGTLRGNRATKGQGGGLFTYDANTTLTGGTFTGNFAKSDGGGIYCKKGTMGVSGVYVANNTSKGSGGGMGVTREGKMTLYSGTITGNSSVNAGGIIVQAQGHLDMHGGTITGNTTSDTGAGMYIHKASGNLLGGTIQDNKATKNGGGAYFYQSKVQMDGIRFVNNEGLTGGGGFYCNGTEAQIKNALVSGNRTESSGGGILFSRQSKFTIADSVVEKNVAKIGAGILTQNWSGGTITGTTVRENEAYNGWGGGISQYNVTDVDYTDCEVYGNSATNQGGGMYLRSTRGSNTPLAYADLTNVKVYNNYSGLNGGGICAVQQIIYTMTDCQVYDNEAAETGGGIAHRDGAIGTFVNLSVTGNKSAMTGSGMWISDNTDFTGLTVTGNKAKEGSALYFDDSDFDGESYVLGLHKMGGQIRVCDNEGTMQDMYIGEKTVISIKAEGLAAKSLMRVQLHSGILTNTMLGAYDYEGGELLYTVTAGDRSLMEPEFEQPKAEEAKEETQAENILLYIGVGVFALAVVAVVLLLLLKKKKTADPAAKE